jgi:hypothetical protein
LEELICLRLLDGMPQALVDARWLMEHFRESLDWGEMERRIQGIADEGERAAVNEIPRQEGFGPEGQRSVTSEKGPEQLAQRVAIAAGEAGGS